VIGIAVVVRAVAQTCSSTSLAAWGTWVAAAHAGGIGWARRKSAAKRALIDTGKDMRRGAKGQFKEADDVGRSLKRTVSRGQGGR
jgi:hypothetical protein